MDWKKLGRKLLFPPVGWMVALTVISAAALVTVFVKGLQTHPVAYGVYVLSFYTLTVVCIFCAMVLPKQYQRIRQRIYDNPLGYRYMTDRVFRTKVSLYVSLCVNFLYAGLNILLWYWMRSWWFVVLAGYYAILSTMRFLLVRYVRANRIGSSLFDEWRRARICACILLLVNLSLSGAVLMILYQNRGFTYPGILIYVMAAYTFYSTIHAVVEIIRYRKLGSPVMSAAKLISLSAALVSLLSLETAMFSQFGAEMAKENQQIMVAATGAGVSIIVVTLSVLLIVRATKEIRSDKSGE